MERTGFFALNDERVSRPASRSSPTRAMPLRAACASSIQPITAARPLTFFAYAWGEQSAGFAETHEEALRRFAQWGFTVNPLSKLCRGVDAVLAFHRDIAERRSELPYDIDGVVYKVNDLDLQERLGFVVARAALGPRA